MKPNYPAYPVVLVADDDSNAHLLLERAFQKAGARASLTHVHDGLETLKYLAGEGNYADRQSHPLPDLLLLDLKMPKMTGFDVLENIRVSPQLSKFPVVVFSASALPGDVNQAYQLGCDSFVRKPSSNSELVELAKAIVCNFFKMGCGETDEVKPLSFSEFSISQVKPTVISQSF